MFYFLVSNITQIYVSKGIQSGHFHGFHSLLSDSYDCSGFYFAYEVARVLAFALESGIGHIGYKPGLVDVIPSAQKYMRSDSEMYEKIAENSKLKF